MDCVKLEQNRVAYSALKEPEPLSQEDLWQYNKWLYGPAGSGKTRSVTDGGLPYYDKTKDEWWDNYEGQ